MLQDEPFAMMLQQQQLELLALFKECSHELLRAHEDQLERHESLLRHWLGDEDLYRSSSPRLNGHHESHSDEAELDKAARGASKRAPGHGGHGAAAAAQEPEEGEIPMMDSYASRPASVAMAELQQALHSQGSSGSLGEVMDELSGSLKEDPTQSSHMENAINAVARGQFETAAGQAREAWKGMMRDRSRIFFPEAQHEAYYVEIQRSLLGRIVNSDTFKFLMCALILLNTIAIGYHTQYLLKFQLENPGEPGSGNEAWVAVEEVFLGIFTLEIILRIAGLKCKFFFGPEKWWNLFDLVVLFPGLLSFANRTDKTNVSFFRVLRVQSFIRVFRIVRVMRNFSSLRVMVVTLARCSMSLGGVFVVLFFVMYCFTMLFMQAIIAYIENSENVPAQYMQDVELYYGSVSIAMTTLFEAISGGIDWHVALEVVNEVHWAYKIAFLFYVYFTVFGVLNVLTSMFIDTIYQVAQQDRDARIEKEINDMEAFQKGIKSVFYEADKDNSGYLSWEQFERFISDRRSRAWCASMELDVTKARALFLLLDVDKTNSINIDEFVLGCMRLKGLAKSIDVNLLLYEHERMMSRWQVFMQQTEANFKAINGVVFNKGRRRPSNGSSRVPTKEEARKPSKEDNTWTFEDVRRRAAAQTSSAEATVVSKA